MRDIKYDTVLRKCRENDAAEMYVANTIWPTDEGPVSGKAVAAALATKQPLITPDNKLPADLVEGGGGTAEWGGITGNIADQTDLKAALAGKLGTDAVGVTVAGLVDGKVPAEELPDMDYIPTTEKGAANGVAGLDSDGKVPAANIPSLSYLPLSGGTLTGALNLSSKLTLTSGLCVNANTAQSNNEYSVAIGPGCQANSGSVAIGYYINANNNTYSQGRVTVGRYNDFNFVPYNTTAHFVVGTGTSANALKTGFVIYPNAIYASNAIQQGITTIPSITSAYMLAEGCFSHIPEAAPTYTLPTISDATRTHEIILNVLFRGYYRSSTDDSGSAYAWKAKDDTILYTDTPTITAGTTLAYSDTALTTSVGAIAMYDSAKSGIAMVGSLEFEDAGENVIAPLDGPSPSVGAEICYLCEWSALQGQWTIMPIDMGGEA